MHYYTVMATLPFKDTAFIDREELARRWALAAEPCPDDARGPRWQLLLREFLWPLEPVRRALGKPDREEGERERRNVGRHVPRVGEQRE